MLKNNSSVQKIIRKIMLLVANFTSNHILPPRHGYRLRNWLYRLAGMDIAEDVQIFGGSYFVSSNISIGSRSSIARACRFSAIAPATIKIGDGVGIGQECFLVTGSHEWGGAECRAGKFITRSIVIGDGAWIGMRATILDGTEIGKGCIVAAGAVVRGTFGDNMLIAGVPARAIRELE